jgi:hypothetical protein
MREEKKCCGNCKHWNNRDLEGCDLKTADTGEVQHYDGNGTSDCPEWERKRFGKK